MNQEPLLFNNTIQLTKIKKQSIPQIEIGQLQNNLHINDERNQKNVEIGEKEQIYKQQSTKEFNEYLEEEEEGKIQSKSWKQIEDIELCVKNDNINSLSNIGKTGYSELSIQSQNNFISDSNGQISQEWINTDQNKKNDFYLNSNKKLQQNNQNLISQKKELNLDNSIQYIQQQQQQQQILNENQRQRILGKRQEQQIYEQMQEEEEISRIFQKALQLFKFQNKVTISFYIVNFASVIFYLIFGYKWQVYDIFELQGGFVQMWGLFKILALFFGVFTFAYILKLSQNLDVVWEIAQQYNEVLIIKEYEFSDEANNNHEYKTIVEQGQLPENDICPQNQYQMDPSIEFKIDELQYKIRKQLKKKNNCIRFISLLSFFFQHIAFYFEICLVYLAYSRGELNFEDEFNLKYFLGALYMIYNIFCQLIQFHEFYLTFFGMGIFYALVLGTYCFQGFYNCIEGIMIWMNVFRFKTKKLKKFKYSDKKIEGEKICSICMNDYDSQEFVTILPCNTKHHFHYSCIIKWFKTSFTCPLCREEFLNI